MKCLLAIIGPTGIGKSQLALRLAQTFNGEIVSADSRQVYRQMDIGTAKPSNRDMLLVPHHLVNIVSPDEDFSLSQYQRLAYKAIEDIQQRDKPAILVGGSGLYVWSVLEGWGIPQVPPDPEFRHNMEKRASEVGTRQIYDELVKVDLSAAQRVDQRNMRRVIRALEVHRSTQTPISQRKQMPPFNMLIVGLTTDRAELYCRIDLRVDEMIRQGLIEEVKKLVNMGYDFNLPAMSSIGYKQIGMFVKGEITMPTAIQQIKYETHRLVRHQYNWFRLKDDRIKWFDISNKAEYEIETLAAKCIGEK